MKARVVLALVIDVVKVYIRHIRCSERDATVDALLAGGQRLLSPLRFSENIKCYNYCKCGSYTVLLAHILRSWLIYCALGSFGDVCAGGPQRWSHAAPSKQLLYHHMRQGAENFLRFGVHVCHPGGRFICPSEGAR